MTDLAGLLSDAAARAARYRAGLADRPVAGTLTAAGVAELLGGPLPAGPTDPAEVIDLLARSVEDGLTATAGPRFFGFVVGGALPAASAADMLAVGWDQLAFNAISSPAAAAAEAVAGRWLKELLGIPATASVGFATGAQAANTIGLAAARQWVLAGAGWDVGRQGLFGAPRIRVLVGAERHRTIDRALRLLGLGTDDLEVVDVRPDGAIEADDLDRRLADGSPGPLIVCLQSGNVNTGAGDDLRRCIDAVHRHGGWAHVDGAFGLWAAASSTTRALTDGIELADSWCCDGHKWLNVPYDSGFAFVADPAVHAAALSYSAAYLTGSEGVTYGPGDLVLESSRRARGFAVWAALRELGSDGVAELVDRCCRLARRFADGLAAGGLEIVNDVVLNQILVGFGGSDTDRTDRIVNAIQQDGTCWMGTTTWRGRRLMRISVSNYATTELDIDLSVASVLRMAAVTR